MPSLDLLAENPDLDNLKIFPINIGKDTNQKSLTFFEVLGIKNLEEVIKIHNADNRDITFELDNKEPKILLQ